MNEPFRPEGTPESGGLLSLLKRRLPLEAESAVYILVNAFDVWTTYLLLSEGTIFVESNPVPVKVALARLSRCGETVRPPLGPPGEATRRVIDEALRKAGLLEDAQ